MLIASFCWSSNEVHCSERFNCERQGPGITHALTKEGNTVNWATTLRNKRRESRRRGGGRGATGDVLGQAGLLGVAPVDAVPPAPDWRHPGSLNLPPKPARNLQQTGSNCFGVGGRDRWSSSSSSALLEVAVLCDVAEVVPRVLAWPRRREVLLLADSEFLDEICDGQVRS